jgi:hypothetical protein
VGGNLINTGKAGNRVEMSRVGRKVMEEEEENWNWLAT